MQFEQTTSEKGTTVPVAYFEGLGGKVASLLMLPAMGVRAKFYKPFAKSLSAAGINVCLMEQRGHGESPYRPARSTDFNSRDYILEDIPVALAFMRGQAGAKNIPLYIGGHSMGGHMSACFAALKPDAIDGLMLFACGLPYAKYLPPKEARAVKMLAALTPFLLSVLGYFPGHRLGFAGKEYRSFMRDWRIMALTGRYDFDVTTDDIETQATQFTKPVAVFSIENDTYAPIDAVLAVADKFTSAPLAKRRMFADDLDGKTGHFDWVKGMDVGVKKVLGVIRHFESNKE